MTRSRSLTALDTQVGIDFGLHSGEPCRPTLNMQWCFIMFRSLILAQLCHNCILPQTLFIPFASIAVPCSKVTLEILKSNQKL